MAHAELPGVRLRYFSTTCAVYIEDCEVWWLSSCRSSVAEHWLHKPGVLDSIPGDCRLSHFLLQNSFHSKYHEFVHCYEFAARVTMLMAISLHIQMQCM